MGDFNEGLLDEPIIETNLDLSSKLLDMRMRTKRLSQLSYELSCIEKSCPDNHYEIHNAEYLIGMYEKVEKKILEVAEEIKK